MGLPAPTSSTAIIDLDGRTERGKDGKRERGNVERGNENGGRG
jgi:hypothetical protein